MKFLGFAPKTTLRIVLMLHQKRNNQNRYPCGFDFGGIKDFAQRAIFLALPSASELPLLCGGNANLFPQLRFGNKIESILMLRQEKK